MSSALRNVVGVLFVFVWCAVRKFYIGVVGIVYLPMVVLCQWLVEFENVPIDPLSWFSAHHSGFLSKFPCKGFYMS